MRSNFTQSIREINSIIAELKSEYSGVYLNNTVLRSTIIETTFLKSISIYLSKSRVSVSSILLRGLSESEYEYTEQDFSEMRSGYFYTVRLTRRSSITLTLIKLENNEVWLIDDLYDVSLVSAGLKEFNLDFTQYLNYSKIYCTRTAIKYSKISDYISMLAKLQPLATNDLKAAEMLSILSNFRYSLAQAVSKIRNLYTYSNIALLSKLVNHETTTSRGKISKLSTVCKVTNSTTSIERLSLFKSIGPIGIMKLYIDKSLLELNTIFIDDVSDMLYYLSDMILSRGIRVNRLTQPYNIIETKLFNLDTVEIDVDLRYNLLILTIASYNLSGKFNIHSEFLQTRESHKHAFHNKSFNSIVVSRTKSIDEVTNSFLVLALLNIVNDYLNKTRVSLNIIDTCVTISETYGGDVSEFILSIFSLETEMSDSYHLWSRFEIIDMRLLYCDLSTNLEYKVEMYAKLFVHYLNQPILFNDEDGGADLAYQYGLVVDLKYHLASIRSYYSNLDKGYISTALDLLASFVDLNYYVPFYTLFDKDKIMYVDNYDSYFNEINTIL